jgi:membrane protein DedA with SNARE-associated domain
VTDLSSWRLEQIALGVFTVFFVGAMARGQAIYWLARVLTDRALALGEPPEGWRRRAYRWLHSDGVGRARASLARWGWPLVPFAYLTVGFQSMVMAAAGMVRMPWKVFTLAQIPGSLAWALIYTTVGFAFWGAFFAAVQGNPGWAVLLVALLVAAVSLVRRRRRQIPAQVDPAAPRGVQPPTG